MNDFNPTALTVVALFTCIAAMSGDWLAGLTVGLATIFVCGMHKGRNDLSILLIGGAVLAVVLLV